MKIERTRAPHIITIGVASLCAALAAASCAYNETIGRNQLIFVSSGEMASLASSSWTELKQQTPTTTDPKYTARVKRVAERVVAAAGENPAQWDIEIFKSDQVNAFALPGGKIGVYTGILDIIDNDDQLATVLGHEVAHVELHHSAERYSQSALAQAGLTAAQALAGGSQYKNQIMGVLGVGVQGGYLLPFSRKHELEADRIGLGYMHKAGYNVDAALKFWEKMAAQSKGAPPEFLSTHPSDATRIAQIKEQIALIKAGKAG
ncbi:MAG TPA: M48 family metallopeptidase [Parvularculaceae bacterium]|nr:M48 family metallopeptidase [Parvularculaceae bacterium]